MQRMIAIVMFVLIAFLQAITYEYDPQEHTLVMLPPDQLEMENILLKVVPAVDQKNFIFDLIIDNQSMQELRLNKATDIKFAGEIPLGEGLKSDLLIVLPNEKNTYKLIFPRKDLAEGQYQFNIKNINFLLNYKKVNPWLENLKDKDLTIVFYYDPDNILVSGNGRQGVLFVNNSAQQISQLIITNEQDQAELKSLDYKHWFIPRNVSLNQQTVFLIRERPGQDMLVIPRQQNNKIPKKILELRQPDQYYLNIIPERIKRGGDFLLRVFNKNNVPVERMTCHIFAKSIALKKISNSVWEKRIEVPHFSYLGKYNLKVYIKDAQGVVVCAGNIEVM